MRGNVARFQEPQAIGAFLRDRQAERGRLLRLIATRANGRPAFACDLPGEDEARATSVLAVRSTTAASP